jgi:hypothetical protein
MAECVNWSILLAIVGAALGLFLILLLAGGFLMRCLDAGGRADADRLPVVAKNEPETGLLDCVPHCVEVVDDRLSIPAFEILHRGKLHC